MEIIHSKLNDCVIIKPKIHNDERGFFLETYQENNYASIAKINYRFVQDNHSKSSYGILRGLHYQQKKPQGKLVRVTSGSVFDVAVDLRKNSSTYGKWDSCILSAENKLQFWIPPGFAHGFLVLSKSADFEYKCTDYYDPDDEKCIIWNDEHLRINWPIPNPTLSKKDKNGISFTDLT